MTTPSTKVSREAVGQRGMPTQPALLTAYQSGYRFLLMVNDYPAMSTSRSDAERTRGYWQQQDAVVETFYILPDGATRLCAKGKRT